ncbi:uncharacterized protein LOC125469834 [Pyrus x bretschneideri]|uniref:uncharacterized protein LOC125469834 n=1 Tax=Pyrus x bretschneideri TaxID=225117 RepID=UPI0020308BF3|nr:uncharacterized protein LOC125469834 [Pyrus x bretschneideri]
MSELVKLESLLRMLTIKLNDDNFIKWNFQFCFVLCWYGLFDHFTGDSVCPHKYVLTPELGITKEINTAYRDRIKANMALLSLLIATLSDDAMEHKGGDSVDKYLLRLKVIKDKLVAAGEKVSDNDIVIAALTGLPTDFDMIQIVILARETPITLKEFRAQLLGAEKNLETRMQSLVHTMAAMYGNAGLPTFNPMTSSSGASSASGSAVQFPQTYGYGFVAPGSSTVGFSQFPSFSQPTGFSQTSNGHNFRPHGNNFQPNGNTFGGQGNRSYGNTIGYKGRGLGDFKPKFNGFKSGNVWSGNTSNRQEVIPEFNCRHRGNFSFQGAPPPPSLSANYAYQDLSPVFQYPTSVHSTASQSNMFSEILRVSMSSSVPDLPTQSASECECWIVDSGASVHMSLDINLLEFFVPYNGNKKIIVGNGTGLDVQNIGTVTIQSPTNTLYLRNVLQDKATGVILYGGQSSNNELFRIPVHVFPKLLTQGVFCSSALLGKTVKSSLWHRRLGHPSNDILAAMLKNS